MGALDNQPFGVNSADGAEGDKNEAIKRDTKFTGDPETDMKFEGQKANGNSSAAQMNYTGRE